MKKKITSLFLATALIFPGVVSAAETTPVVDQTQTEVQVEQPTDTTAETPVVQTESTTDVQADVTADATSTEQPTVEPTTETTSTEQPAIEPTTETTSTEGTTTSETTVEVDPGLTPEDATYFLDTLFENVQLTFTFDAEKKAQVYAEISAERLAELKTLDPATQSEFVKNLLVAYEEALTKAGEQVEQATAEGTEVTAETTEMMDQAATEGEEAVSEAAEELEVEEVEALEESIISVKYTAAVVRNIDPKVVQSLREQGIGYGKIALTVSISNLSGKSVKEVNELLKKSGIGKVAKDLGIHPGKLKDAKMTITVETEVTPVDATTSEEGTVEAATSVVQTLNITDTAKAKKDKAVKELKVKEVKEKAKEAKEKGKEKAKEKSKENKGNHGKNK